MAMTPEGSKSAAERGLRNPRLQVCKQYVLWGLQHVNRTYFEGSTGVQGGYRLAAAPPINSLSRGHAKSVNVRFYAS